MKNKKLKIVVTGGSGFIGGYVYRHLKSLSYDVYNLDLMSNEDQKDGLFLQGSILDIEFLKIALKNVDIVLHFAGFANINRVKEAPLECLNLNIIGTSNILEVLRKNKKGSLILASSAYVQNENKGHLYTTSKYSAELICKNYFELYKIPSIIMRLGTVYGEFSRHEDVVSIFAKNFAAGLPLTIHGDGLQKRNFIHGEDIGRVCEIILNLKHVDFKTFFIAPKLGISIIELVELIKIQGDTKIEKKNIRELDNNYTNINEEFLNYDSIQWEPSIDINQGLKRLINYFKDI